MQGTGAVNSGRKNDKKGNRYPFNKIEYEFYELIGAQKWASIYLIQEK